MIGFIWTAAKLVAVFVVISAYTALGVVNPGFSAVIIFAALIVGIIARNRGRYLTSWWLASLLLSPLIVGVVLFLVPSNERRVEARREMKQLASGVIKKCPACAEIVKSKAVRCRHCRFEFYQAA